MLTPENVRSISWSPDAPLLSMAALEIFWMGAVRDAAASLSAVIIALASVSFNGSFAETAAVSELPGTTDWSVP